MKKWVITPEKFLKEDEIKQFRSFMEDRSIVAIAKKHRKPIRDWGIIDIAMSAGLRASEIGNLQLKDVHVGKGESALFVHKGKGDKSRLVMIGEKLKKHLRDFLTWKKGIEPTDPDSFLFVSERSPKMSLSAIEKRFKHWAKACGLYPHYSIHSMRHTYGTMLYRSTKDLRMVQKQLGHSSCQVTEVYADVLREDVEKAVNLLYA
jgi:site-specific recombinase XerD